MNIHYSNALIKPYSSKLLLKMARFFVHKINPNDFFIKFIRKQIFNGPLYVLSFDLDFEKDYKALPTILKVLEKHDLKACFAVIGKFVEKYPDIHRRVVNEGHELINHTYTHPDNPHWNSSRTFNKLTYKEQKEEIEKAHEVIYKITGYECIGFRTPHFGNLHTESVYYILKELGYRYSSSTAACSTEGFGAPYRHKSGIIEIPLGGSLDFPLAVFDSWNMRKKAKPMVKNDEEFLREFEETIKIVAKEKKFLTHYFDPYDIVENNKIEVISTILENKIITKTYQFVIDKYISDMQL